MTFTRDNIDTIEHEAARLVARADMLQYQARKKRVTHTVAGLIRCLLSLGAMCKVVQSDKNFVKLLERACASAHEAGTGSFTVEHYINGTVWIKGAFHIGKLRDGLMTIPQRDMTIEMERTDG